MGKSRVSFVCSILMMSVFAYADEVPNGKDAFVSENAVNIPVGRILLAKRNTGYCAMRFVSSRWSEEESYATYKSYYIPDSATGFTDSRLKPREDEVYQKQPLRIIGRFAAARSQDTIFCERIKLKWSGAPKESGWVYLDEERALEIAPTKWGDIKDVNVLDKNLKWFRYGDAGHYDESQKIYITRSGELKEGYVKLSLQ